MNTKITNDEAKGMTIDQLAEKMERLADNTDMSIRNLSEKMDKRFEESRVHFTEALHTMGDFLIERMDGIESKLSKRIDDLDVKLSDKIDAVGYRVDTITLDKLNRSEHNNLVKKLTLKNVL